MRPSGPKIDERTVCSPLPSTRAPLVFGSGPPPPALQRAASQTQTPSAPSASAPAMPRPSTIPPEASTVRVHSIENSGHIRHHTGRATVIVAAGLPALGPRSPRHRRPRPFRRFHPAICSHTDTPPSRRRCSGARPLGDPSETRATGTFFGAKDADLWSLSKQVRKLILNGALVAARI